MGSPWSWFISPCLEAANGPCYQCPAQNPWDGSLVFEVPGVNVWLLISSLPWSMSTLAAPQWKRAGGPGVCALCICTLAPWRPLESSECCWGALLQSFFSFPGLNC